MLNLEIFSLKRFKNREALAKAEESWNVNNVESYRLQKSFPLVF